MESIFLGISCVTEEKTCSHAGTDEFLPFYLPFPSAFRYAVVSILKHLHLFFPPFLPPSLCSPLPSISLSMALLLSQALHLSSPPSSQISCISIAPKPPSSLPWASVLFAYYPWEQIWALPKSISHRAAKVIYSTQNQIMPPNLPSLQLFSGFPVPLD